MPDAHINHGCLCDAPKRCLEIYNDPRPIEPPQADILNHAATNSRGVTRTVKIRCTKCGRVYIARRLFNR